VTERTGGCAWLWVHASLKLMRRPDLPPGARAERTWLVEPLALSERVKAVEYEDEWGNLYRQDLPKLEAEELNCADCGEPRTGDC